MEPVAQRGSLCRPLRSEEGAAMAADSDADQDRTPLTPASAAGLLGAGRLSAVEARACGMPATGLGLCCDCGHRWWAT